MIEFIHVLILQSTYDSFPSHIKNSILNASVSTSFLDFNVVTLSGKTYLWIEADKNLAMQTELKYFEFIPSALIQDIIQSGQYTTKPYTPALIDDFKRVRFEGVFDISTNPMETNSGQWEIPVALYNNSPAPIVFSGMKYQISGGNQGDKVTLQVVDVNNILGHGADTVLEEFVTDFYVAPNETSIIKEHKANTYTGLFLKVIYKNTGTENARFFGNLLKYIDTTRI